MRNLLLLAVLLPLAASAQGVALVDRIVAVVNKDVITATELDDAVAGAERQLRRQGTRLPDRPLLERQDEAFAPAIGAVMQPAGQQSGGEADRQSDPAGHRSSLFEQDPSGDAARGQPRAISRQPISRRQKPEGKSIRPTAA